MNFIFKIGEKIKEEAWPLYKKNLGLFLLMFICFFIIQIISSQKSLVLYIVSILLSIFMAFVFINFLLSIVNKKEFELFSKSSFSIMPIWNFLKTYILFLFIIAAPSLLAILPSLYSILNSGFIELVPLSIVGLIVFVIVEIYLSTRLVFALYISVEKNKGAVESIKESWNITKDSFWIIFIKMLVIGLFSMIGFLAFFVGVLITYPMSMILVVLLYRDLKNFKEGNILSQVENKIEEVKEKVEEIKENI